MFSYYLWVYSIYKNKHFNTLYETNNPDILKEVSSSPLNATILRKKLKYKYNGYDHRYPKNYSDPLEISIIKKLFQQKQWLDILTNNYISINDKMKVVDLMKLYNNESKASNLFYGLEDF
jgi:hypothetical protein